MESLYMKEFPGTRLRVKLVKEDSPGYVNVSALHNSAEAYEYLQPGFMNLDREVFVVLLLNQKNVPLGVNLVSIGSLIATTVHPREVFKPAILASAASLIVAHNHPSGDPAPSAEDKRITAQIVKAGELLGIRVLDHIILGENTYYSFGDSGELARLDESKQS